MIGWSDRPTSFGNSSGGQCEILVKVRFPKEMRRYILFLAAGAVTAFAQPATIGIRAVGAVPAEAGHTQAVEFVHAEFGVGGQMVKNAPYTAEAVTESVQTLSDGNRIVHKNSTQLARDSEGRTRRDATVAPVGALAGVDTPKVSFIHDPVSNTSITLDHTGKTARKMQGRGFMIERSASGVIGGVVGNGGEMRHDVFMTRPVEAVRGAVGPKALVVEHEPTMLRMRAQSAGREESLGKRNIEGVMAEGTRITDVIPAGEIGNERPIEIVTERWYSPELQTLVMTRHSDPRMGETTYKLVNIQRSEPPRSLFEAPADYAVKEAEMPNVRFMRERGEKAKE